MNWDDFRVFLAVVDSGGMGRAARRLQLSHATVWRRIRTLEESLRLELFDRSAQGFVLSEAGSVLFQRLRVLDGVLEDGVQAVWDGTGRARGEVKVCLPFDRLAELIAERLPDLRRRHPELTVELLLARPPRNPSEDYDLVVSLAETGHEGFDRVSVRALRYGLYSAPEYAALRPRAKSIESLVGHSFVDFDRRTRDRLPTFAKPFADLLAVYDRLSVSIRCSHPYPRRLAAAAGMGVILSPEIAIPADAGLVQLADWRTVGATPISLHVNGARRNEPRVTVVRDLMLDVLAVLPSCPEHLDAANVRQEEPLRKTG